MTVEAAFSELSFPQLVFLTHAGDGTDRLFAVERRGRIKVFPNAQTVLGATTFLNITEKVNSQGLEEGLLGLAFDPGYRDNGHFYVYYSVTFPRRSVLSRFSVSATDSNLADPGSERVIMEFAQPYANHNGGHIAFGPDGYLYLGLGDGGSRGDPRRNGQNPGTLLGSILRIDVRSGTGTQTYAIPADNPFVGVDGARPEIWAYGLRNPWRFSFDRETGDLWAGDVGQNEIEEIDLIRPGLNYGWNVTEGTSCFTNQDCDTGGFEPPVAEYGHDKGCSVTGGYVYRGARLPSLNGAYVYGDFCSGRLWALRYDGSDVVDHVELDDTTLRVSSFGEDEAGELYILSLDGGIYRLTLR
jgi:glucose/arabinose dehydrogenase